MNGIHLGPIQLIEPLARGGMGEVWRGVHAEQGVGVAVKVLSTELLGTRWRERFRCEVRAMARLDHPGVIWVFDYGEVPAGSAPLPAGAPWVALELATQGTLEHHARDLTWTSIRALLLELLDILAHAHARRVIHRDLKPANVLVCGPRDLRPGLKLTDFGIAALLDDETLGGAMLGTPAYMAPEQVMGDRFGLGPGTDLYALGCVAWELATGQAPFVAKSRRAVLFGHVSRPVPPFTPRISVPARLEEWLRILLCKAPEQRFARAADAAAALRELSPHAEGRVHGALLLDDGVTVPPESTEPTAVTWVDGTPASAPPRAEDGPAPSWLSLRPGCPRDWRRPRAERRQRQLQGAGLALVGLRAVPLAGRVAERDLLWAELVAAVGGPGRAAVLRGPAGTGKTRLALWLGERAHELGVAAPIVARHTPDAPEGEGVAAALRASLELGSTHGRDALCTRLGDELASALLAWLHESRRPPATVRLGLIGSALEALSADRPVVLHLDDVQWDPDALLLLGYLLDRQRVAPSRLLVVATAQEEALADHPRADEALAALCARSEVRTLRVEPLGHEAQLDLLDGLLGLDAVTTEAVLERSGGHPLFAVQLVADWAARGWLVPGARGFRLEEPARAGAFLSLDALWSARLDRILEGLAVGTGPWLERAALWGDEVSVPELHALGAGLELGRSPSALATSLVQRLVEARLADDRPDGFAFAHGLIRDALRQRAGARLADHHSVLGALRRDRDPVAAGRHFLAAGRPAEAAAALLGALADHERRFGVRSGLAAVRSAEEALAAAGAPPADERWGRVHLQELSCLVRLGRIDEHRARLAELDAGVRAHGWSVDLRAGVALSGADDAMERGAFARAEELLQGVLDDPDAGEVHRVAVYGRYLALGEYTNDLRRSARAADRACASLRALGDPRSLLRAAHLQCVVGLMVDDMAHAEPFALEAVARAEELGDLAQRARAWHNLGKVSWCLGRYDEADTRLARSEELHLRAGQVGLRNPRLVRIQLRLVQQQWDEALALAHDLQDREGGCLSLDLLILVGDSGRGLWTGWAGRMEAVGGALRARSRCNGEDARALEQLAGVALAAGRRDEARCALEAALDQWGRHDLRDEQEARVAQALELLS